MGVCQDCMAITHILDNESLSPRVAVCYLLAWNRVALGHPPHRISLTRAVPFHLEEGVTRNCEIQMLWTPDLTNNNPGFPRACLHAKR